MPETAGGGPTRAEELRALALDYLSDPDMATYGTNTAKVRVLASRLGNEDNWNAFATIVRLQHTAQGMTQPNATDLKAFLNDLKKAVVRVLRRAAREPGAMAAVTNIDDMLNSESPMFVCVGLLLRQRRGRLWFDDFLNQIMSDWKCDRSDEIVEAYPIGDDSMRKIMMWLMAQNIDILGHLSMRTVTDAVYYTAELDHRDTLSDHVKGMPQWDAVTRLDVLMVMGFGCEIDDDTGQTADYLRAVGRNWMVSLVARALRPGVKVDTMPVFMGSQGAKKSTAMAIIGGPFYREISESPANKDFYVDLRGCWVGEIAELASIASSKVEVAKVKAMLSRVNDHYRDPYGRVSKDHLRRTVFAGTGNLSGWMRDESGGRRFWPVVCGNEVDFAWLRDNRSQLIAEALSAYENGETWWEVPEEAHALAVERQQQVSVYEETIRERLLSKNLYDGSEGGPPIEQPDVSQALYKPARWGNVVTQLLVAVCWLGIPFEQASRSSVEISAALVRLGWRTTVTSVRIAGRPTPKSIRCWVPGDVLHRQELRVAQELNDHIVSVVDDVAAAPM